MRLLAVLLLAACDPDPIPGGSDLAQARSLPLDDGGVMMSVDFAVALPAHCPCPLSSYCDLSTNSCKAGCLGNDQCPMGSLCDTQLYQCVAVCDPSKDCPNHVRCQRNMHGFNVCGECVGGWGDCNQNPADGCETQLNSDANCGKCGGPPTMTCYQDKDGDRYVVSSVSSLHCTTCPSGQIPAFNMQMGEDCDDNDPAVNPGQISFFDKPSLSGSWDYNCDGFIEPAFTRPKFFGCSSSCDEDGWSVKPDCGQTGTETLCHVFTDGCGTRDIPQKMTCR